MLKKMNQKGYFFGDAFGDMLQLAVGILVLVIAINLFIPFANILTNAVAGTTLSATIMVIVWVIPLLFVAMLIMPVVNRFRGGGGYQP